MCGGKKATSLTGDSGKELTQNIKRAPWHLRDDERKGQRDEDPRASFFLFFFERRWQCLSTLSFQAGSAAPGRHGDDNIEAPSPARRKKTKYHDNKKNKQSKNNKYKKNKKEKIPTGPRAAGRKKKSEKYAGERAQKRSWCEVPRRSLGTRAPRAPRERAPDLLA